MLASILRTYMSRNNGIYLSLDSLCELAKGFIYSYFFFGSEYSVFVFTGIGHPLNSSHFGHFSDATSHASHAFSRNACRGFHETSHTFHAFSRAVSHSLVCSVMLSPHLIIMYFVTVTAYRLEPVPSDQSEQDIVLFHAVMPAYPFDDLRQLARRYLRLVAPVILPDMLHDQGTDTVHAV